MDEIRLYAAARSPYSRMGMHIIKRAGIKVRVIPFDGPPAGIPFSDPTANPAKMAYAMVDVPRMAKRLELRMRPPNPLMLILHSQMMRRTWQQKRGSD